MSFLGLFTFTAAYLPWVSSYAFIAPFLWCCHLFMSAYHFLSKDTFLSFYSIHKHMDLNSAMFLPSIYLFRSIFWHLWMSSVMCLVLTVSRFINELLWPNVSDKPSTVISSQLLYKSFIFNCCILLHECLYFGFWQLHASSVFIYFTYIHFHADVRPPMLTSTGASWIFCPCWC